MISISGVCRNPTFVVSWVRVPVTTLGRADVDRVLTLVREAASARGGQPFDEPVIQRLLELVPADRGGYYERVGGANRAPSREGRTLYNCEQPAFDFHWEDDAITATMRSWPLLDPYVYSSDHALLLSDFLTSAQKKRRNPWYMAVQRDRGVEHECKLLLPAPDRTSRGFFLVRGPDSHDFNERDRDVLTVLRPQLNAIREEWERRNRPDLLTPRENEILQLVADGLTNKEIARRLVISPTTVRTHLENVFEKLEVGTRTAAVAAAFGTR
jgi:DNA-binding CsgD family transcriptional regulator